MNDAKLQALVDLFNFHGADVMCNTSDWCELTCDEQMLIQAQIDMA